MMENKGQLGLLNLVLFIVVVPVGFIMISTMATHIQENAEFHVPVFGSPALLIWVAFFVLVIAFGWSLATSDEI